jgi:tRNA/rRNA methyltransferase
MAIVLHRPKYPENIGASARAALNMGISRLVVVEPRDCDLTRILKMATHFAADLVEKMEVYEDLETALSPGSGADVQPSLVHGKWPRHWFPSPRKTS